MTLESLEAKLDSLKELVEQEFSLCRENCKLRLDNTEKEVKRAHKRLDNHAESIRCLKRWKNRMVGAIGALTAIFSIFSVILAWLRR